MTQVLRMWPLLTATHRYDKSLSTRNRGNGQIIEAPILAYLIETTQGRILYDVGCDYRKIESKSLRERYYDPQTFAFGAPDMQEEQRLPHHLQRLGLTMADIDLVFLGHLHFDHAGGLCEICGAEVHVQHDEMEAARSGLDPAYFPDDFAGNHRWKIMQGEYDLVPGVRAISSPGHTAGHMSLWVELPRGAPVILCGDAADLEENLRDEIAPGICWQERDDQAVQSIRKLKNLAANEKAQLWPNHDLAFWKSLCQFPEFHD
ncbi:putative AHL-lactonase [Thiomonas arsenitoxydans]|uniref:AHL-lactonase n=2 Tax=Thiomonas TaxID=32012 RepID=D6CNZ1_THIA3|nr:MULTISPECIES: N-acyl homoserine lactonase family protein [Thiomonas]VDY05058.1 putative AHL-lactonase [Thiomonas sp. Bio17B3]VDY07777.1 putative AHL-lactonase [Thiomonas sp. Sup16B3]CAZ90269.1 putative AHL-lactonase [Thiomonas arsenitoxydans]CDW93534.1 putative AHL-lactonase [Thiomonas sp. CB2]CQR28980.1 putative AHL-lactonase [Thiomonas arsenitoxydans]